TKDALTKPRPVPQLRRDLGAAAMQSAWKRAERGNRVSTGNSSARLDRIHQEEAKMANRSHFNSVSRRGLLQAGTALAGGALASPLPALPALADNHPAVGTYPAGSSGNSV